ncbi:MAG: Hsp20/alpha crystallin family protein [Hyphomicrobiales bacterium]|nr:Hsp20/alpha crystallin family protein [Hyphomicrobiales bacterium]
MNLRSLIPIGRSREVSRRDNDNPFFSLQREIDRLFDDFGRGFPSFGLQAGARNLVPAIDVTESDSEIEITAELPGLEEKDVEINVADNVLTIRGEKKAEKEDKQKDYHVIERSYGSFYRAFELPSGVETDKITADISKGVLKVKVPKPAMKQAKKIEVKPTA